MTFYAKVKKKFIETVSYGMVEETEGSTENYSTLASNYLHNYLHKRIILHCIFYFHKSLKQMKSLYGSKLM